MFYGISTNSTAQTLTGKPPVFQVTEFVCSYTILLRRMVSYSVLTDQPAVIISFIDQPILLTSNDHIVLDNVVFTPEKLGKVIKKLKPKMTCDPDGYTVHRPT